VVRHDPIDDSRGKRNDLGRYLRHGRTALEVG
jgi:hypothetical protein